MLASISINKLDSKLSERAEIRISKCRLIARASSSMPSLTAVPLVIRGGAERGGRSAMHRRV